MKIKKVLLSAGIHGNEKTPFFLIASFQQNPDFISRNSFETETLIANPQAVKLNQRYVDVDLNRCFNSEILNKPNPVFYEEKLAQHIAYRLEESAADFILDFHSSTSMMGITLLLSSDRPFNLQLASYLAAKYDFVRIITTAGKVEKNRLRHLFPFGFTVEIGAIAPNVIDPIWFKRTEILVKDILDYLEQTNGDRQPPSPKEATVYSFMKPVFFPTNNQGEIIGMVAPDLHNSDYTTIDAGQPIFLNFDGTIIYYQGDSLVPIFINESAYFEQKIAFYLTKKQLIKIPDIV